MKNTVELIGYYGSDETHACSAWTSTSREFKVYLGPLLINGYFPVWIRKFTDDIVLRSTGTAGKWIRYKNRS